jgi:hypothetical protein
MTIFYALAYDWEEETGEQVVCFNSQDARDRFVDNEIGACYADEEHADRLCMTKHNCTAREALNRGLI